jgi:hypothetical protein
MTKEKLVDLLVVRGIATREQLQSKYVSELEQMLDESNLAQIHAQAAQDPAVVERLRKADSINDERIWAQLFFKNPDVVDNFANRNLILDYALSLSSDGVVTFQHMDEAAKTLPGLARQKVRQVPTAANLKQDEENLRKFCRENGLEPSTAALTMLRETYGSGFESFQINQALDSHLITLGPASDQIRQEAIAAENSRLKSLDIFSLRKLAREAGARGTPALPLDETQQVRLASGRQYEILPSTILYKGGEELVDNHFLLRVCDTDFYKYLLNRYGSTQLTARINNKNYFTSNRS